jgi:Fe-S oxidoreductase
MSLEDYRQTMETCCRCSACKFIPFERVEGYLNVNACPSISRYNFHGYSGGGRLNLGVAMMEKQIDPDSKKLLEVVYNCQMCGACDVSCKYAMDMEVLDPITEIRAELVKKGNANPVLDKMVASLKKDGPMVLESKVKKENWFKGLEVKDYSQQPSLVVYHAGCRTCYDQGMWSVAQNTLKLMQKAGINVAISTKESCCGGRAYQMGYPEAALKRAKSNMAELKKARVKTLVTGCAECYFAFKVLYDKFRVKGDLEVLHTSEYFARLIQQGKLKPQKEIDMAVTYHDPCHLGRQGEPYIHWKGKQVPGQIIIFDPPKEFRRGSRGVYEPPREVLKSIPGLKLIEMPRNKEYTWCCGSGGGVRETNPDFAAWTASERIREAASIDVEAIVTGCPGCENGFRDAIAQTGSQLTVVDIVDILTRACI